MGTYTISSPSSWDFGSGLELTTLAFLVLQLADSRIQYSQLRDLLFGVSGEH
jgi:hypothetical protein